MMTSNLHLPKNGRWWMDPHLIFFTLIILLFILFLFNTFIIISASDHVSDRFVTIQQNSSMVEQNRRVLRDINRQLANLERRLTILETEHRKGR